jgi:hypothetical protein
MMCRTKATLIYQHTKNLRAFQLRLDHTNMKARCAISVSKKMTRWILRNRLALGIEAERRPLIDGRYALADSIGGCNTLDTA